MRKHELTPGAHEVTAKLEGYKDAVGRVTIELGKEKNLSFEMEALPKDEPAPPPAEPEVDLGTTPPAGEESGEDQPAGPGEIVPPAATPADPAGGTISPGPAG